MKLMSELQAIIKTIQEIDMRIGGLQMVYTKKQYGKRTKNMRNLAWAAYKAERNKLMNKQASVVSEIDNLQKRLPHPIVTFK